MLSARKCQFKHQCMESLGYLILHRRVINQTKTTSSYLSVALRHKKRGMIGFSIRPLSASSAPQQAELAEKGYPGVCNDFAETNKKTNKTRTLGSLKFVCEAKCSGSCQVVDEWGQCSKIEVFDALQASDRGEFWA